MAAKTTRAVEWVDGVPVCQRPSVFDGVDCDDCYGVGKDGDGTPVCMAEVRDDRALLVAISREVYGPDYSEPYDEPRALAGLVDAVRAVLAKLKEAQRQVYVRDESLVKALDERDALRTEVGWLRGVVELYKRSDELVTAGCHCDGGCGR